MACGLVMEEGYVPTTPKTVPLMPSRPSNPKIPSISELPPIAISSSIEPQINDKWIDLNVPKQLLPKLIESGISSPTELASLFTTEQQLQELIKEKDPNREIGIIDERRFITSVLKYKQKKSNENIKSINSTSSNKNNNHQKANSLNLMISQSDFNEIQGSVIITDEETQALDEINEITKSNENIKQEIETEKIKISTEIDKLMKEFEENLEYLKAIVSSKLQENKTKRLNKLTKKSQEIDRIQNELHSCRITINQNLHSMNDIQQRETTNLKLMENTIKQCKSSQSDKEDDNDDNEDINNEIELIEKVQCIFNMF